jgi:hypothetical protein
VKLLQTIAELDSKVKALTEENNKLAEIANEPAKNSKNSSIPPSKGSNPKKDPLKLDENGNPIKGKPGAKKGHKAHHRKKNQKARTNLKRNLMRHLMSHPSKCQVNRFQLKKLKSSLNPRVDQIVERKWCIGLIETIIRRYSN